GRVFHDDFFYHQRMSYFLDYFTFVRPIQGSLRENDQGSTPYKIFMASPYLLENQASELVCRRFAALENFRHSLFQIVKISKNRMVLRDLLDRQKFEIRSDNRIFFQGFTPGSF